MDEIRTARNDCSNRNHGIDYSAFSIQHSAFAGGGRTAARYLLAFLAALLLTVAVSSRASRACDPSCDSSIPAGFNFTSIPAGRTVWFNSVLDVSGLGQGATTVFFREQTISFTAGSHSYTLPVPDAAITF
jgi:hypothetical protein